jgi:hypothetical protein
MPEVLERFTAIEAELPANDGVAYFNRMYRVVTEAVQAHQDAGAFGDPAWLSHLDVVFANLYLAALRDWPERPQQVPRAWAAVMERRADVRIAPLQFAFAGMNAHINHDLPLAVVMTSTDLGTTPGTAPHPDDYQRINDVLASVEPTIRGQFENDLLRALDAAAPGLQDVVANFNLLKARSAAWVNAQTLWALRQSSGDLASGFMDGLDHLVGFAGRGLLVPLLAPAVAQAMLQ